MTRTFHGSLGEVTVHTDTQSVHAKVKSYIDHGYMVVLPLVNS